MGGWMHAAGQPPDPTWFIQRLDSLYQRLWIALAGLTVAAAGLFARVATRPQVPDATAILWSVGVGAVVFIWLGHPLLEVFYKQTVPSSTRHLVTARVELAFRYIKAVGVPATIRFKSLTSMLTSLLAAGAFFVVRGGGWGVIGWFLAASFIIAGIAHLTPHVLPRSKVMGFLIGPVAALDTMQRNPRSKRIDKITAAKPWAQDLDDRATPIHRTRQMARLYGKMVAIVTPFYLVCMIALLFLGLPVVEYPWLDAITISTATLLGLATLRLFAKLRGDQTREFAEQLPTLTTNRSHADQLLAGYLVIDVFRENDYRWNLPLAKIISKLDARRLVRDAST